MKRMEDRKKLYQNLPNSPGVYLMKDAKGGVMYVGKAASLKRRVSSYFLRPHDSRIESMVAQIAKIGFQRTDTAIEALMLEAELIKKLAPPYNVREKDDKSFLCVEITKDKWPRVILARGKDVTQGTRFGPFTSATSIREALRIIRRIFPYNTHEPERVGTFARPCFDAQVGLCPGACVGGASREEYLKTVRHIKLFFEGKKAKILKLLQKDMKTAAKALDFEGAERLHRRIFALQHIQDVALIRDDELPPVDTGDMPRIEGYDISNISGTSAVGSMVVFRGSMPDKAEYRKFKIKTVEGSNDVGMLQEVLRRRFRHVGEGGWPAPDLILIDGGIAQVNAARQVLHELGIKIPLVGLAKGPERKKNELIGRVPPGVHARTLIAVRDEAHRFAIKYHKKVRGKAFLS
jgi:excinuclease ABC subunit C